MALPPEDGNIAPVVFGLFLFLYAILFFFGLAFIFALIEIGIINYVFQALGLSPHLAFLALLASLAGSYFNIPITQVDRCDSFARRSNTLWRSLSPARALRGTLDYRCHQCGWSNRAAGHFDVCACPLDSGNNSRPHRDCDRGAGGESFRASG